MFHRQRGLIDPLRSQIIAQGVMKNNRLLLNKKDEYMRPLGDYAEFLR